MGPFTLNTHPVQYYPSLFLFYFYKWALFSTLQYKNILQIQQWERMAFNMTLAVFHASIRAEQHSNGLLL